MNAARAWCPRRLVALWARLALPALVAAAGFPGVLLGAETPPTPVERLRADSAANARFLPVSDLIILSLFQDDLERRLVVVMPRVDRQIGASASTSHATTVANRPGIPDYLDLTVEHNDLGTGAGATDFTATFTPASLYYVFIRKDTPEAWDRSAAWRRLALSATVEAGSADGRAFQSAELKYVLIGNRSPRDRAFRATVMQALESPAAMKALQEDPAYFIKWKNQPEHRVSDALISKTVIEYKLWREKQPPQISTDQVAAEVAKIVADLRRQLGPQEFESLRGYAARLVTESEGLAKLDERLKQQAQDYVKKNPEVSVAYGFGRDSDVSDYSYFDLIADYQWSDKLSSSLDGNLKVNHAQHDSHGATIDRLRSYAGSASLTAGKFWQDRLEFSAEAKLEHSQVLALDFATTALKVTITPGWGLSIPVTLSHANRTETSPKSTTRVSFGVSLDLKDLISK